MKDRGLVRHREPYWALGEERTGDTVNERPSPEPDRPHREPAAAFFERVRTSLDSVDALYLFGSAARDAEWGTSDVDVLAVIEDEAKVDAVDDRLLDIAYDIQLEYGILVDVHTIGASEFASRRDRGEPFVRSVVEEGTSDV